MSGQHCETMTSNGKQLTVTREMLTAVALDQRWPDVVAGISARFSKFAFVLFCYITNQISIFPLTLFRETKFTVALGTSH